MYKQQFEHIKDDIHSKKHKILQRNQYNIIMRQLKNANNAYGINVYADVTTRYIDNKIYYTQHHGWKFIYRFLNPRSYVNPSSIYSYRVLHDYFVAHLENAKAELEMKDSFCGGVKMTDMLQYMDAIYGHRMLYGHQLNYLKWLQDDGNSMNMTFSNMDFGSDYIDPPMRFSPTAERFEYFPRFLFNYQFNVCDPLFTPWDEVEVIPPQLLMLKANLSAEYFAVSTQLQKAELASMKRVRLTESGSLTVIPSRVSMLISQFA